MSNSTNKLYIKNGNQAITALDEQEVANKIDVLENMLVDSTQIIHNENEINNDGIYMCVPNTIAVTFDTHDIVMKYRDGTRFIANVYENGILVTDTKAQTVNNYSSDNCTLIFGINDVHYARQYSASNNGVALNINMMASVNPYTITTYYVDSLGQIHSTTNTITITN